MRAAEGPRLAVVGMAGRFPGAPDLATFWANLAAGVESIRSFSDRELADLGVPAALLRDPRAVKSGPLLEQIDRFDAQFFGLSVREAERIDPQQRLLLECAWEALEQAGWSRERFSGRVGVYVGAGLSGYLAPRMAGSDVAAELETLIGNDKDYAATRLSYKLDLRGPSVTVQTACSTSLVAIHTACQALLAGECDLALAGGARVRVPQEGVYLYQEGGLLSPDGRCRAFDAQANGTIFGSGAGIVALKRLEDALADGDVIDAVVLGSAVNNDGAAKVGYVAPSVEGQTAVIAEALAVAGVDADSIGYVEAHGTGTPLGDPIEVAALSAAFRQRSSGRATCALGSVKTNFGHLETAAGVAGFIKTVLALKHRQIPPSLNFDRPNPHIDFEASPFRVNTTLTDWPARDGRRRAGVSSFGIGGTNAHVVLEEAPAVSERAAEGRAAPVHLVAVSGRGEGALREQAARLAEEVERCGGEAGWLQDASYTSLSRRTQHLERACVVGRTAADLKEELRSLAGGGLGGWTARGRWEGGRRRVVFVYSGQGSQWVGMGRRLLQEEGAFAARLRACDEVLRGEAGFSVVQALQGRGPAAVEEGGTWKRVEVIQPLLFAMQVALTEQWRAWGVEPDAVVGHSLGEVAASVAAGSLSLEDGARVIATRSRLVSQTCGRGRMALLELSPERAARALGGYPGVSIASHHGPETVLVSGEGTEVQRLVQQLEGRGVFCRLVDVDYASHSPQVDGLLPELRAALRTVRPRRGQVVHCSTLLGDLITGEELDGDYWTRNLREPVRFHQSVEKLLALGHDLFLEVSPHPVLTPTLQRTLQVRPAGEAANDGHPGAASARANGAAGSATPGTDAGQARRGEALGSLRRGGDEVRELALTLAQLHVSGAAVDWARHLAGRGARAVRLPAYAWQRERFWMEGAGQSSAPAALAPSGHWLGRAYHSALEPGTRVWEGKLGGPGSATDHLHQHRVHGVPVVAGAVWLEAALHVAQAEGQQGRGLEEVEFTELLALDGLEPTTVQLVERPAGFELYSLQPGGAGRFVRLAAGRFTAADAGGPRSSPVPELERARGRCSTELQPEAFYDEVRSRGIEHGPLYAGLTRLWLGAGEAVAELAPADRLDDRWTLAPWTLDACLQALGATRPSAMKGTFLPVGVRRLELQGARSGPAWVHARCSRSGEDELEGEVRLYAEDGTLLLAATGVVLRRVGRRGAEHEDWLLGIEWRLREAGPPAGEPARGRGTWLVLGEGPLGDRVVAGLERAGARCERLPRGLAPDHLERALLAHAGCRGIVHLWAAESDETAATIGAEPWSTLGAVSLVQQVVRAGARDAPRIWFVTRGAQPAEELAGGLPSDGGGLDAAGFQHAALWGLARTLAHEHPELRPSCVDLSDRPSGEEIDALVAELILDGPEDQVALRGPRRLVARLARVEGGSDGPARRSPAGDRPFALEMSRPGVLEALALHEAARPAPGPGEVEIEVQAAGLNLLDVLLALGALPDDAPGGRAGGPRLGGECSGRVTRVGPGVEHLRVGQAVMAVAPAAFRSFVLAPQGFVAGLPEGVDPTAAAGFPIAFLTAHLALRGAARLARGERILIHAGATGVGLAAVQLALLLGAEVLATAGSPAKRDRLAALGVRHVLDSRSLDFAAGVMEATGGEGVDVVLNSLSGEFIPRSLSVLREGGRFVEIGKRDYYENAQLGLRPFLKGLSLTLVDLRALLYRRPQLVEAALKELVAELGAGRIEALPVEVFPVTAAADAFRHMAGARHLGKVVLAMQDRTAPIAESQGSPVVRGDGSYLITGGLGALGLEVAGHLVDKGARRLVLMGRRPPAPLAQAAVERLRARGAEVLVVEGDVCQTADLARARDLACAEVGSPLRGVVHAAGILDDGILVRQTPERIQRVMAPKTIGAWNLHLATLGERLDFFVLFSSIASILGAPGQAGYAAGNAFLDALAHHRRAHGLPALSLNWGPWGEVGLAAAEEKRARRVAAQGVQSLTTSQGIAAFEQLLASARPQVAVVPLDLRQWVQSNPLAAGWRLLGDLAEASATPGRQSTAFEESLRAAPRDRRRALLEQHIAEQVGAVLRLPPERVEPGVTLASLGLDSLTGLEFRNRLERSLGTSLRATLVFAHPTPAALTAYLASQMGLELTAPAAPAGTEPAHPPGLDREIEAMSDVEAEAALLRALDGLEEAAQ